MFTKKLAAFISILLLFISIFITFLMITINVKYNIRIIRMWIIPTTLLLSLFIAYLSVRINRYNPKLFIFMLLIISFIQYTIWNFYAKTNPVSDYRVILEGASKIINGTFSSESFDKTSYFYFYNYQIGYTAYAALIMKIIGNSILGFKVLEGLYLTFTSLVIYKISDKLYSKDSATIASILFCMYVPNIMGVSVINNQHLSTMLLSLSLFFLIKDTKKSIILSGALLALVQILRPIAIIVIIAVLIRYTYSALKEKNYGEQIKKFLLLIAMFMLITKGFDFIIMKTNISPGPISKSNAKYFKFVLGFKGSGIYDIPTENARKTQVYFDLETVNFDYDKYNELCLQAVKEALWDYKNTGDFIINKMSQFIGRVDNQYDFAINSNKLNSNIYRLIEIGHVQYIFLLIFAFGNFILRLKNDRDNIDMFSILMIGFVLVHVFIEVQTRYRYEIYVIISILAAQFLSNLLNILERDNKVIINSKGIYINN